MFIEESILDQTPDLIREELRGKLPDVSEDILDAVTDYVKGKIVTLTEEQKYKFWTEWYAGHRKDGIGPMLRINDLRRVFELIFGPLQRPRPY